MGPGEGRRSISQQVRGLAPRNRVLFLQRTMGGWPKGPFGGWPKGPWPPWGEIHSREASAGEYVHISPIPQGNREINGYLFTTFTGFSRLSWDNRVSFYRFLQTLLGDSVGRFVVLEFYSRDYLSTRLFFFSEFDLQRNYLIRSEELFELSSILLLSRCLEACQWQFLKLLDKHRNLLREQLKTCPIKKCRQEASNRPESTTADFLSTRAIT